MKRLDIFYSFMLICLVLQSIVSALPPYTPQYYLKPAGLPTGSNFGNSISVSENATYLAVSAYLYQGGGAVQLYTRSPSLGQYTWNPSNFIFNPSNVSTANFGNHIRVNENILLVGAPGVELVYVYVLNSSLTVNQTSSLSPSQVIPAPAGIGGSWGRRVGLYNSTLVIAGDQAVVIYSCNLKATSNICTLSGTLNNPGNMIPFGERLAIWGNTVVVGSFSRNSSSGVVYLYNLPTISNSSSGNFSIDPYQTLYSPAANMYTNNQFGKSIDIRGSSLAVGAAFENNKTGNVYYYTLNSSNLATPTAVFSLPNTTTPYFNASSNTTSYTRTNYSTIGQLGQAVGIYNNQLLIGASGLGVGSILIYNLTLPNAAPMIYTPPIATGSSSNNFGFAVSIQTGIIAIGATGDDTITTNSNAVTYLNATTATIPTSSSKNNRSGAAYVFAPSCPFTTLPNTYNRPLLTCATNSSSVMINEDLVVPAGSSITFGYINNNVINGNLIFLPGSGMINLTIYGDNRALIVNGCMSNPRNVNLMLDFSAGTILDSLLDMLRETDGDEKSAPVIVYKGLCNGSNVDNMTFNSVSLVRAVKVGGCAPMKHVNDTEYRITTDGVRVTFEMDEDGCNGQVLPSSTPSASAMKPTEKPAEESPAGSGWTAIIIIMIILVIVLMAGAGVVSYMRMQSAGGEGDEASRLDFGH
eukprot:TRINITY_DN4819_c0_g1_i1.p1 TRINITY_DN4819_c0_g1~~TRINITY_DN4819_c0_g1_i1.p1  ORF type:complete len:695 (+),score=170.90 TRINITY_DN4819_c0_g1_i1:190-2274(+)